MTDMAVPELSADENPGARGLGGLGSGWTVGDVRKSDQQSRNSGTGPRRWKDAHDFRVLVGEHGIDFLMPRQEGLGAG